MKLDGNRYVTAIKDGFFGVMSLLIIGSFFLLLLSANLPALAVWDSPGFSE